MRRETAPPQVLLAIIVRLWQQQDPDVLESFLTSRSETSSMPFLSWLADREAAAVSGSGQKAILTTLCEMLVLRRERLDVERMDSLYQATMGLLADHAAESQETFAAFCSSSDATSLLALRESAASDNEAGVSDQLEPRSGNNGETRLQRERRDLALAAMASDPVLYATQLSQKLTGSPVLKEGFSPMFDLILKAAPPAALTLGQCFPRLTVILVLYLMSSLCCRGIEAGACCSGGVGDRSERPEEALSGDPPWPHQGYP